MNIENRFIQEEKEFDFEETNFDALWDKVESGLDNPKKKRLIIYRWSAACILVLVLLSGLFYHEIRMHKQIAELIHSAPLNSEEGKYIQHVNQKWQNYKSLPGKPAEIEKSIIEQLQALDNIYNEAVQVLKVHGYNDQTMGIILDTHEKRLLLLDMLIAEKQKNQEYETDLCHL